MIPKFTHDCTNCKFIATIQGWEVYRCPPTNKLIARHSDFIKNRNSAIEIPIERLQPCPDLVETGHTNPDNSTSTRIPFLINKNILTGYGDVGDWTYFEKVVITAQVFLAQIYTRNLDWENLPWWDYTNIKFRYQGVDQLVLGKNHTGKWLVKYKEGDTVHQINGVELRRSIMKGEILNA